MEIEIGIGKSGRRAYGFDDVASSRKNERGVAVRHRHHGLKPAQVEKAVADARAKVDRRSARLRQGRAALAIEGRSVIVVDDGIAAGSTMRAAIAALRRKSAGKIVIAVPTAHQPTLEAISKLVDETFCANVRGGGGSFAVADAYEECRDLPDEEIETLLENRVR